MVTEQIIKQTKFYLDFKSFTYCIFLFKIKQSGGKKPGAGKGMVGGKKVQEIGSP